MRIIEQVMTIDRELFLSINNGWCSPTLDILMVFLSLFGNGLFLAAVVGGALFFLDRESFARRFFVIVLAVGVGALVNEGIKEIVQRPRPLAEFTEGIRSGSVWVHTVFDKFKRESFPSGHTEAAFGTATALAYYYRKWFILPIFALACGTGISRIYLGVHFPLDVAAGAAVGIICSVSACWVWERGQRVYVSRRGASSERQ